jgi:probable rRNA maturation factor
VNVFLANEQPLGADEARLSALARYTLDQEGIADSAELSVLLVDAEHIKRLNARFAGNDYATDVLAFPMMEDDDVTAMLGDIVIAPEVARQNADRLDHSLGEELEVLLVHGILHLLGYDHQGTEDKARMEGRLAEIRSSFLSLHAT